MITAAKVKIKNQSMLLVVPMDVSQDLTIIYSVEQISFGKDKGREM
jgi:hypothetical protein